MDILKHAVKSPLVVSLYHSSVSLHPLIRHRLVGNCAEVPGSACSLRVCGEVYSSCLASLCLALEVLTGANEVKGVVNSVLNGVLHLYLLKHIPGSFKGDIGRKIIYKVDSVLFIGKSPVVRGESNLNVGNELSCRLFDYLNPLRIVVTGEPTGSSFTGRNIVYEVSQTGSKTCSGVLRAEFGSLTYHTEAFKLGASLENRSVELFVELLCIGLVGVFIMLSVKTKEYVNSVFLGSFGKKVYIKESASFIKVYVLDPERDSVHTHVGDMSECLVSPLKHTKGGLSGSSAEYCLSLYRLLFEEGSAAHTHKVLKEVKSLRNTLAVISLKGNDRVAYGYTVSHISACLFNILVYGNNELFGVFAVVFGNECRGFHRDKEEGLKISYRIHYDLVCVIGNNYCKSVGNNEFVSACSTLEIAQSLFMYVKKVFLKVISSFHYSTPLCLLINFTRFSTYSSLLS